MPNQKSKPLNVKYIQSNINSVFRNKDISKLSKMTYQHITLHMGFIAHMSLEGFQCVYEDLNLFANKLLTSEFNYKVTQAAYEYGERYRDDKFFANRYGKNVADSWADASHVIREAATNFLHKNGG